MKLKPVFGYLHRNHEKIGENTSYLGSMPYTDRLDYLCSMTNNWAYALAVEKLAGQAVPERAEYLRVILAELTRLLNHTCLAGFLLQDCGASGTPLMYAFREREKILDLFESLSGSRMMCNYQRFGGCRADAPPAWLEAARAPGRRLRPVPRRVRGPAHRQRDPHGAHPGHRPACRPSSPSAPGVTGPMLRAAGVDYDIRKVDGYGVYPRFDFRVPLGAHGDTYDRYMVRILEMRESIKILQQALRDIPAGPGHGPEGQAARLPRRSRARSTAGSRARRARSASSSISDGGPNPYRYRVRPPSFINLTDPRGPVPRPLHRRRGRHPRQHRHRPRRGRPLTPLHHARHRTTPGSRGHRQEPRRAASTTRSGSSPRSTPRSGRSCRRPTGTSPSSSARAPTTRWARCAASPARSARRSARRSASTSRRARTRSPTPTARCRSTRRSSTSTSPSA